MRTAETGQVTRSRAAALKTSMPPPDAKGALADALVAALRQDSATADRSTLVLIKDLLEFVHDAVGMALDEAKMVLDSQKVDLSTLRTVPSSSVDPSDLRIASVPPPVAGPSRVRKVVSKDVIDSADEADAEEVFGDVEEVGAIEPDTIEDDDNAGGPGGDVGEGDGDDIVDAEGDAEIEE